MGRTDQLRELPDGWRWEGPAAPYLEWLDHDVFLAFPFAIDNVLPAGSEDSTWVLHSQYVCPLGEDPDNLGNFFDGSGFSPKPPEWWQRVLWKDVAAVKAVDLRGPVIDGREFPPSDLWEAVIDRPLFNAATEDAFLLPSYRSMSRADLEQLIPILAAHTTMQRILGLPPYMDSTGAINNPGQEEDRYVFSFPLLNMLNDLLDNSGPYERFTPELWWPEDRSWLVWNDWDLMGTKIFGSRSLIQQIREHPGIESLDWFPTPAP